MKKTIMPMPVHSIAKTFLSLSNIQAHLMYLGKNIEAVDSLKKTGENIYKKNIEESRTKQTSITIFPVNQLKVSKSREQFLKSSIFQNLTQEI